MSERLLVRGRRESWTRCRSPPPRVWPAALVAFILLTPLSRADGSGLVCADPRVRVEGILAGSWLEPVVRMCESLGAMRDADASVQVRVVAAGDDVIVEARLPDGRVALRRLHSPDDLQRTVEALVLLPPEPEPEKERTDGAQDEVSPAPLSNSESRRQAVVPSILGVEIGLEAVARLSSSPTYLGAGGVAHAGIRPGKWLLALALRLEPMQTLAKSAPWSFEMDTVGVSFLFARRLFQTAGVGLDLGATASFVSETQSVQSGGGELSGSAADVRVGIETRGVFGATWAFAPSLSAELSPARVDHDIRIDPALPPLPSWSIALGLGAVWEGH